MQVRCTIKLYGATVEGIFYDVIDISWIQESDKEGIIAISYGWLSTKNFVTEKMVGLESVAESDLIIEPLEDQLIK